VSLEWSHGKLWLLTFFPGVYCQAYVAEDEDQTVIIGASAVMSEAEIKQMDNKRQNRVLMSVFSCFCLLLLAAVLPIPMVLPRKRNQGSPDKSEGPMEAPSDAPSASPTSVNFVEFLDILKPLYPSEKMFDKAFSDVETPQSKAATWASTVGSIGLAGNNARMISRFALATFYYSTNGEKWAHCGQNSANCALQYQWLGGENECEWLHVSCQDPQEGDHLVTTLDFREL